MSRQGRRPTAGDNPVVHHYARTVLRFGGASPFEVDLRRRLTAAQIHRLRTLGLGRRFGIVTPHDPFGRAVAAAENGRRLARLRRRLAALGRAAVPADGLSIDRRHCEHGYAVAAPRADVVALGRAFQQTAVFWFDGARFLLVWCAKPRRGVTLPRD